MEYDQQPSDIAGSQSGSAVPASPKAWFEAPAWADYIVLVISLVAILAALYFALS